MPGLFSLPKNLCLDESARVLAGELEGAAARLEWDQMPRKPCCARLPASEARTFAPNSGAKVTAFCRLSEKSLDFFDSLYGARPLAAPRFYVCSRFCFED